MPPLRVTGNHPGWSVAARITLWYGASALLLLSLVATTLYWSLSSNLDDEITRLAEQERAELVSIVASAPEYLDEVREEILRGGGSEAGIRMWMRVLDDRGNTLVEAPGMTETGLTSGLFPAPIDPDGSWGRGRFVRLTGGTAVRTFAARMQDGDGSAESGVVEIAVDCATMLRILRQFRIRLAAVAATGFLVLLLVGYLIARRGLEPMRAMAATMQRIGSTTLHERVDRSGLPSELWVLASAFNDVLERLDASFVQLAQFSGDIAHELRTPLSRMRLAAEVALQRQGAKMDHTQALGECLEEAVKLSGMIDRLLFLARSEGPQSLPRLDVVDLHDLLGKMAEFYHPAAEEAHISLTVHAEPGISVSVDRELLLQAVGNLIQNALAYTAAGGEIRISATMDDDLVVIAVRDNGCGIPASHLPHLFDAFHRVDRARATASGGTGLGLAIVKKIARLHGGDVRVASELGFGTEVTLSIPRTAFPGDEANTA